MNQLCFVIMPYGKKKDIDGKEIDFDKVYESLIRPAVNGIFGLQCERCDDIELPGWIHERMLRHIFEDRVAIVDTSTLNANVFYELGVRHALRKSVTVLIHKQGTSWPFNIAGLSSIEYSTTPTGIAVARKKIQTAISNALNEPDNIDSLVYYTLPNLMVQKAPNRLTKMEIFLFPLKNDSSKQIAFVTGDREDIMVGDVWVISENTNMQMDSFYGKSTSATVRYLGAKKNGTGSILEDTIADELRHKMGNTLVVDPASVIPTRPGELERNQVKWLFHVAAVAGEPREGYRPVSRIDQCVKNALRKASDREFEGDGLRSILFPVFGTGPGGGDFQVHAEICVKAAVEFLEGTKSPIETVYFYAWSDVDLEKVLAVAHSQQGLKRP
jgi:O-acetyl-ADP-ribose deacetylase (regulator of RNase III)